jgi:DNA-binding MarR family transcriptional regulator
MSEPNWLEEPEMVLWRRYLRLAAELDDRLEREMQADHGLSMSEYEVLVHLSDVGSDGMRMTALAEAALVSKTRLSHSADRLESAGLMRRRSCPSDRRGTIATLTPKGRRKLEKAAPSHVRGVRAYLVDAVGREDLAIVSAALARALDALAPPADERSAVAPV